MADHGCILVASSPILAILVCGRDILAAGLAGWAAGLAGVGFWLRVLDVRLVFLWPVGRFVPARPQASAVSDRFPI